MTDLARLVVRLEAETSKYQASLEQANSKLDRFERNTMTSLGKIDQRFAKFGSAIKGALAVLGGAALLGKTITASAEAAKNFALLENAVERAGQAAGGRSAKQFAEVSKNLQAISIFSDDAVQGVQQILLRFQNIRTDRFDEATKSVLNFASATGRDAPAAAELLGKALAAPEKGMTQLARAGVILSEGQKDVIKNLVETGRRAEAQGILLDALEQRFGGAAEAARNNFSGALAGVKNALDDLFEADSGLPAATESLNELSKVLQDPAVRAGADALFSVLIRGAAAAGELIGKIAAGLSILAGQGGNASANIDQKIEQLESKKNFALALQARAGVNAEANRKKILDSYQLELAALERQQEILHGIGAAGSAAANSVKSLADASNAFELPDIEFTDPSAKLEEAADKLRAKLEAAGAALTNALLTPLEIYNQKVAEADRLLAANVITQTTWARALGEARGELDKMNAAIEPTLDDLETMIEKFDKSIEFLDEDVLAAMTEPDLRNMERGFDELGKQLDKQLGQIDKTTETFFTRAAENAQDILGDGIYNGIKNGFDDGIDGALNAFADMLLRLAAQAVAANIGGKIFGDGESSGGEGGGGGGILGTLFSSIAGFFAGGRAGGGDVSPGLAYRINEKTPKSEWFVPKVAGRVASMEGFGGTRVTQHFSIQAPRGTVSRQTEMQLSAAAARGLGEASRRNN